MASTVIVALPSVDTPVYKVSSEKKPHLTLLYLGDHQLSPEAMLHVEHACSKLFPFGLSVDYRGTLGDDQADVLFFGKENWDLIRVKRLRHHLLLNDEIKLAYDSAEQFPEWTPHLTLGYPESPAKALDEDNHLGYIQFDRVGVWVEDFEGPEFRLKHDYILDAEVAMSADDKNALVNSVLEKHGSQTLSHYGVKGMKWGVRNDRGHEGERVKTKKLAKLDKKWEKNENRNAFWQAHNEAAEKMNNGEIDRINNKPEHKKAAEEGKFEDWENPSPELDAYMKDMDDTFNSHFSNALVSRGSNPSGTKRYQLKTDENGETYAELTDIKHASEGSSDVRYKITKNNKGLITAYILEEVELKHYGVKGMKWGVRKDEATSRGGSDKGPTSVVVTQRKPGTYAKSSGGKRLPISDDARTALESRQKARASTTDALSNAELRKLVERMNLERQYADLNFSSDRRSKGQRFIQGFIGRKRYGKEKRRFEDEYEMQGEYARLAADRVKSVLQPAIDLRSDIKRTDLSNIY